MGGWKQEEGEKGEIEGLQAKHHRKDGRFSPGDRWVQLQGKREPGPHCTIALDGHPSEAVNETSLMKFKGNANRFL